MKRHFYFIAVFLFIKYGCNNKRTADSEQSYFRSFELTIKNTVVNDFSILVDSSKSYFLFHNSDSMYYGILPDSLFNKFKEVYFKIKRDKTLHTEGGEACFDCVELAIKVTSYNDTIRIHKYGDELIDFEPFVLSIIQFCKHNKHQSKEGSMYFETQKMTMKPPQIIGEFENSQGRRN